SVRVAVDVGGFLIDSVDVIRLNTPYGGTAAAQPGTIQAENFDNGGEGVAYHDTTATNEGGAYRTEAVDLCSCGNADGAALGWAQAGEWTRYTMNFNTTDTYALQAKVSTIGSSGVIHLEVDGIDVTGPMVLPNTGAWDSWTTVSNPNVQISAGQHELKMVIESGGFLLDSLTAIPSLPSAPSGLAANAVSNTQINLVWADNSFNESGFKVERKIGPSGTYAQIATPAVGATSFSDTGLQPGTQYFYRVRATNLGGNSVYSNEASATTVNLPPSVSLTSPGPGSVFTAPATIPIAATASDVDGTVSKVEFFQDGVLLGEDTTSPYSFTWNNVPSGTYALTTRATDNLGVAGTSSVVTVNVVVSSLVSRLDPLNGTGGGGENPLSRNYNWSLPLLNLPGRAGLGLELSLSYNSLVWTRTGNYISFDDDRGFPSPGFRLGFPVIQPLDYNSEAGKNAFLLLGADGGRTELRQLGTSTLYLPIPHICCLMRTRCSCVLLMARS
ncbi:MAG TPA: Ig-like domain-containing protein, partial [Pyrinomonadaceae bacterium]